MRPLVPCDPCLESNGRPGKSAHRGVHVIALAPAIAFAALASAGCASIPRGTAAVDSVSVEGNDAVSDSDVEEKMATASSPKFLGLFSGIVYDYEIFDRNVLQRDLERVERFYRARGYYEAHARAGRVRYAGPKHVQVTILVEEGKPVLIREMRIDGTGGLSAEDAEAVRLAMRQTMKRGEPFEEEPFKRAEEAMKRALTDRGYAWAKVERRADLDLPGRYAKLFFTAHPGPKATFGAIRIAGLGKLPEPPVRRALDITPGKTYSTAAIDAAQQATLNLGTFSSVEIVPELTEPPPPNAVVPLLVRVQQQKLKSVILGGGLELDSIRFEAHVRAGWEHKNLFGGFRHFTVDFKPGAVLYPTRLPNFDAPTAVLPEERFRVELRQPGFIEARTNGVTRHELNTYPVLLSTKVDPKAPVIGYLEYKGAVGLDRILWKLFGAATYNFQSNYPFAYRETLTADMGGVILSYIDLLGNLDLRNDRMRPHEGIFVQNDLQFAGLGGDAHDVRIQPEVRGYIPLGKKVTLAARATVGFLFPFNYGDAVDAAAKDPGSVSLAAQNRDIELIYLRGFFSGGPSSNRGYPLRGIGPQGVVPFLNPGLQAQALARSCEVGNVDYDAARCAVPIGGLSLWEASLEVRFPIYGPVSGATFCDASDVAAKQFTIRLNFPHLSCGLGLRYDTPIGPVRLDVGYRIPGAQVPEGTPIAQGGPSTIYGVPVAVAFGIGEAF